MNVVASPATWGVAGLGLAAALFRLPQFYLVPRVFAHTSSAQWLDGGTIPENVPGTWRTALVVGVLWGFDWAVGRGLARAGLGLQRLPSSIASMLLSVGALGAVQLVAGASTADKVCALFQPVRELSPPPLPPSHAPLNVCCWRLRRRSGSSAATSCRS
eukprot:COSAG04_NODE_221_length_19708_cov_36.796930_14_plen_159_part_00